MDEETELDRLYDEAMREFFQPNSRIVSVSLVKEDGSDIVELVVERLPD